MPTQSTDSGHQFFKPPQQTFDSGSDIEENGWRLVVSKVSTRLFRHLFFTIICEV